MPPHVLVFYALLAIATVSAWVFGGKPERQVAAMLVAATVCSKLAAAQLHGHFAQFETSLFLIDLLLLGGLAAVAFTSDRYWPLWLTPLHAYTIIAHLGRLVAPGTIADIYLINTALMVDPGLIILTAASVRHCMRKGRCRPRRPN